VYKLQWNFTAQPGSYKVAMQPGLDGVAVEVNGRAAGSAVKLAARDYHTLTITPKKPFKKGDRLPGAVETITLTLEK
jgi:copper(I)-binding protein